jgi:NADH-quinone oxidoreductase subunit J
MTVEFVIFIFVALVAIAAAAGLLLSHNAVHAAMFLILNMASLAVIYLLLNAPFIAAVQVAVYAGAIMVLFVFVIMLLGAEQLPQGEPRKGMQWQRPLAMGLAVLLVVQLVATLISRGGVNPIRDTFDSSPLAIGKVLFTTYLLPFEVASVLLLAAMVGAVVMTRKD